MADEREATTIVARDLTREALDRLVPLKDVVVARTKLAPGPLLEDLRCPISPTLTFRFPLGLSRVLLSSGNRTSRIPRRHRLFSLLFDRRTEEKEKSLGEGKEIDSRDFQNVTSKSSTTFCTALKRLFWNSSMAPRRSAWVFPTTSHAGALSVIVF